MNRLNSLLTGTLIGALAMMLLGGGLAWAAVNVQKMGKPKVQTVTTADDVALDANTSGVIPLMTCVDNEDSTNYIRVGTDTAVTASLHGTKILPGQSKCLPGAQTFYARASTADVSVTVTAFGVGL